MRQHKPKRGSKKNKGANDSATTSAAHSEDASTSQARGLNPIRSTIFKQLKDQRQDGIDRTSASTEARISPTETINLNGCENPEPFPEYEYPVSEKERAGLGTLVQSNCFLSL